MPQFEFGMAVLSVALAHATEHEESLLRLLKVGVILTNEGRSRVLGLSFLNLYVLLGILKLTSFHVLVKHDPAHVLNIVELLAL
jgi:hypothetical protein